MVTVAYSLNFNVLRVLFRRPRPLTREIAGFNDLDPALLPWTSKATKQLYLCSAAVIIPASAVQERAAHAWLAGFPVGMLKFGQSAHVSLAREYPETHWDAVRGFWAEAMRA